MNPFRPTRAGYKRTPVLAAAPSVKQEGTVATLRLYDPIDSWGEYWGVSAKEFAAALDSLPDEVDEIRLLINSPGGEVWEGIAIMNALRTHKARVVAVVEGIAASSASFIAVAADELVVMKNAQLFIHNAWGIVLGDAEDLREVADELENVYDRNIASVYAEKSGKPVEYWLAEMHKDRFIDGETAVAEGLADRAEGVAPADALNRFDLSPLKNAHRPAAAAAAALRPPDSTEPGEPNRKEHVVEHDEFKAGLAKRLGVTDAAVLEDDEALLAAVDEALEEQANDEGDGDTTDAPAITEDQVIVDKAAFEDLKAAAEMGRAAREQQVKDRRDAVVDAAVKAGKITPASKARYRALMDTDEKNTEALLESLVPNAALPTTEVGISDDPTSSEDDALMAVAGWLTPDKKEVA